MKKNKTVRLSVRVTEAQHAKLLATVKRLGTTLSKYLRKRVIGRE